jgi:hypothetical protein
MEVTIRDSKQSVYGNDLFHGIKIYLGSFFLGPIVARRNLCYVFWEGIDVFISLIRHLENE